MCAEYIDIFSPKGRTIATTTLNNLCDVLDIVGSEDCEEQGTPPPATCLASVALPSGAQDPEASGEKPR